MIPEEIFVDTGAWVTLADKDDSHHKEAVSVFPSLLKTKRSLVRSNLVIAETYIILLKELGHRAAMSFLERLKASPRIKKIYSTEDVEEETEEVLRKSAPVMSDLNERRKNLLTTEKICYNFALSIYQRRFN